MSLRIWRHPRMSLARPPTAVNLGIDPGVLAAEVAKFVAAAERREARRKAQRKAKKARRRARARAAAATGAGLGAGVFESVAALSVAAEERSAAAGQENNERTEPMHVEEVVASETVSDMS